MTNPVMEWAYEWVKRYLTDGDLWEAWLQGNRVEGGGAVHPSQEEVFAIVPDVLRSLIEDGELPAMDPDVQTVIYEYLSGYQSTVFASEAASRGEEFAEEITNAYVEVCERLTAEI